MTMSRIRCPECDALIRLEEPARVGKRIRCPSCDELFTVEDERDRDFDERSRSRFRRSEDDPGERRDHRSRRDDPDERSRDTRPVRRPGSRRKKEESNIGAIVAVTLIGILLLTGIGIGCYFIFRNNAPGNADSSSTPPDPGGAVTLPMPPNGGGMLGNRPPNMGFPGNRPPNMGMPGNPMGGNPMGGNPFGGQTGKINQENYARVQVGMTEGQVLTILGPPTASFNDAGGPNRKVLHFTAPGGGQITIENGRVVSKFP